MAWTIECGGVEKSLGDWGLSESVSSRGRYNMQADEVSIAAPGLTDGALAFAYGSAVIIRRDRTGTGPYAAGTVYFRGKVGLPERSGEGLAEGIAYKFYNAWWDLARLVFQQEFKEFAGWTIPGDATSDPTYSIRRTSELYLGQALDGTKLDSGEQITEALNWAIACGVALQVGTIEAAADIPIYQVRDVTVAEVILQLLRWSPDITCEFDDSTDPPTFNAIRKVNQTNVVLAVADGNIKGLSLVPRYDLQLPAVCIRFKRTDTVDGRESTVITTQVAPGGATGEELGASVHTIELQGGQLQTTEGELECATCLAQGSDANRVKWWKGDAALGIIGKDPLLASDKIDPASLTISAAEIVDSSGAAVSLASFPNELLGGSVTSWMTVGGSTVTEVRVRVRALASYDLYRKASGWTETNPMKFLLQKKRTKLLSCHIRLTNGVTGTYPTWASSSAGEAVPVGLAQWIYDAHASLEYEGQVVLQGVDVLSTVRPGKTITVNTGSVVYGPMLVQGVVENLGLGEVVIKVGPATHLGLGDLIELLRVNRHRVVINNPAVRSGDMTAGGLSLGKAGAKENTTSGMGDADMFGLSADLGGGKTAVHQADAVNKTILMEVQNADGTRDATAGAIDLKLADCGGKALGVKEMFACDSTGTVKKVRVASSEPYDP